MRKNVIEDQVAFDRPHQGSREKIIRSGFWLAKKARPCVAWLADHWVATVRDRFTSIHIVTSAYVVNEDKVLLINHRALNRWLAPGGHMNLGETPEECAQREVREETGLIVHIIDGQKDRRNYPESGVTILERPLAVQLERIGPKHQHIDLVYVARADTQHVSPARREISDFRWFTEKELEKARLHPNVRFYAKRALHLSRDFQSSQG